LLFVEFIDNVYLQRKFRHFQRETNKKMAHFLLKCSYFFHLTNFMCAFLLFFGYFV